MPAPDSISFRATCIRAVIYILLTGALMQGVYYEALYLPDNQFTERGFTELAQTLLLTIASALLIYARHGLKSMPQVTLLLFGFLFASLIREQDSHLDTYLFDGAWQVLVTLVILPCLFFVIRRRRQFIDEFTHYSNTFSFGLFAAGFLTTYVFSRLYGRSEVWMAILGDHYARTFKDAAEEVTELFGYALLLFAIIELVLLARRWRLSHNGTDNT
ncbi:hypothetical protein [Aidingimonas halophila]|uniref:Uncharacterized protein n=1 Tax=Aidingimonas halophila TaxID=574349 RepID=A0A1H2UET7_9GAMM|nr:hypothetical protein [Aidingimonas halophila]GHC22506.1 hypothetical protein GCM10008094_11340 [Aidingimonas halophila]SDW54428.1 hypothetical protein SAMN05443545_102127 [Aidingimonas halophila]